MIFIERNGVNYSYFIFLKIHLSLFVQFQKPRNKLELYENYHHNLFKLYKMTR